MSARSLSPCFSLKPNTNTNYRAILRLLTFLPGVDRVEFALGDVNHVSKKDRTITSRETFSSTDLVHPQTAQTCSNLVYVWL